MMRDGTAFYTVSKETTDASLMMAWRSVEGLLGITIDTLRLCSVA
jgi:hypothetical protein